MNIEWDIWLSGGKQGYIIQKIERHLGIKAQNLTESNEIWENQKIRVLKFNFSLQSSEFDQAIVEGLKISEKLHHTWEISGISQGEVYCKCSEEYFSISEIKYAGWKLSKC